MTTILNPQQWSPADDQSADDVLSGDRRHPFGQADLAGDQRSEWAQSRTARVPTGHPAAISTGYVSSPAVARSNAQVAAPAVHREAPVDQGRYWVGSALTAAAAAMAGVIGIVIAQDLLHLSLSLSSLGLAGANLGVYGLVAALAALLAAGLYDGMLAFAPRPTVYYCWLAGLLTVLAVLLPFTVTAAVGAQLALAIVNLVVGVSIMTLIPVAASNAGVRS